MSEHSHPVDHPPVPFADFEFAFDPALNSLFPAPPPLPSSADLFSASETTDLLGFLDNFNWEFDTDAPNLPQESNPAFHFPPPPNSAHEEAPPTHSRKPPTRSSPYQAPTAAAPSSPTMSAASRNKPLLSSPQKRLNHIMSEQKRRNAIREGYAQLTTLLAPAGAPPGTGMPTRGRPKGSGSRGKGRTKGKSGVLFRAVEYCHWLEEGIDALRDEVARVEAVSGIRNV
ncbi:hypothetical protein BV25DRAFT_1875226 [Artomyces pyxidatus]|uniref:Uncharacterized protein n=1 Tax=Artomyces pyxidatus TaxID=48021 RepID=A0ACB8TI55_9AGAM|nr:hypothetical protein BV25DRAFT_1875226 [Artomyces pyxidatus]